MALTPPSARTLARYGLTAGEWLAFVLDQGGRCPVCERSLEGLIANIDHEHIPRWKYMPAEERVRYVRGILCSRCNWRLVHSRMPATQAQRIADYLKKYEERRVSSTVETGTDLPVE